MDNKVIDFVLCRGLGTLSLEDQVKFFLKNGYKLHGTVINQQSAEGKDQWTSLCQPMTLTEGDGVICTSPTCGPNAI